MTLVPPVRTEEASAAASQQVAVEEQKNAAAPGDVRAVCGVSQGAADGDALASRLQSALRAMDGGRRDITVLSESSGVDRNVVVLAAAAAKAERSTKLEREALYGLFWTGLPANKAGLALVSADGDNVMCGTGCSRHA